jgi:hypothetical protein
MQSAPSHPLSAPQRFACAAAAALFVSFALISPCRAGPEFTTINLAGAPASGKSADKRAAPSSASMQTFGGLVSAKPANQPLDRTYPSSVDLAVGDLSAGAIRSMPISLPSPRPSR